MLYHLSTLGGAVFRRAAEIRSADGDGGQVNKLPGWAPLVFFADFLVFFPVFLYIGYTLLHVYPTLAIIEDPEPPAYEPVDLNEDTDSMADGSAPRRLKIDQSPSLVSTSIRRINHLLYSTAGWTANFRGIVCAWVLAFATSFVGLIFHGIPFVPRHVGVLLASLLTVQLSTVWTHAVISAPSKLRFYQRLPPFRRTFEATCVPIVAYWAATSFVGFLPRFLAVAMGMAQYDIRSPMTVPDYRVDSVWKSFIILIVAIAGAVLLVIPAQVVLIRVQASLLPPDEDTIVAFDRSYGGKVEPAIVGGKGYVTFKDAWKTFSRESWIRLYKLHAKILGIAVASHLLMMVIIVPELVLMILGSKPDVGPN